MLYDTHQVDFPCGGRFQIWPPQWVRECAIEKKIEKRNVPLEKRLVTIPYKGSRKKNTKEKAEIWIMSLWGHVFSSPLALHLRAEAQYDNLCNYLVPHIYNQGNNFFLKKKTKVNTNHFQNPKKHPLFSLACVDWLILLLLLLFLKLIQCFSVFFHKLYINRPFSSFFCCHQVTLLQNEPPSFPSLHYHY